MTDAINPVHYKDTPPGIGRECIAYTWRMSFCAGNAAKYVYRAGAKGDPIQDLRKALWYIREAIDNGEEGVSILTGELDDVHPHASARAELFHFILAGELSEAEAQVRYLIGRDVTRTALDGTLS